MRIFSAMRDTLWHSVKLILDGVFGIKFFVTFMTGLDSDNIHGHS